MRASAYFLAAFAACVLPAAAQTLRENVSVEGRFRPDVVQPERINGFSPDNFNPLKIKPLDFDLDATTADFAATGNPMGAVALRAVRPAASRGYLDLSLGSWLNSNLSAGYALVSGDATRLQLGLQHNSTSLWRPRLSQEMADVRRWRYDESLILDFAHDFSSCGILEASASYAFHRFNYYAFSPDYDTPLESYGNVPAQTVNDLALRVAWQSRRRAAGLEWNAGVNYRLLDFRHNYGVGTTLAQAPHTAPERSFLAASDGVAENMLRVFGDVRYKWNEAHSAGIDADFTEWLYPGDDLTAMPEYARRMEEAPASYSLMRLTPYWRYAADGFTLRVGADLDFAFNADGRNADSRYSAFHIAPDVRLDWRSGLFGFYARALGGTSAHSLSWLFSRNYYCIPSPGASLPLYTPLDAAVGFEIGPVAGFSAGLELDYRISRNVRPEGWLMPYLNLDDMGAVPGLWPVESVDYSDVAAYNIHGGNIELHARYSAGRIFSAEASVAYSPQHGRRGWTDGVDRARWRLHLQAETRPLEPLRIALAYDYRGVRTAYALLPEAVGDAAAGVPEMRYSLCGLRLPDMCNLKAEASWDFTPRFTLGVSADNLLNQKVELLPMLPSQGIDIRGNLTWRF